MRGPVGFSSLRIEFSFLHQVTGIYPKIAKYKKNKINIYKKKSFQNISLVLTLSETEDGKVDEVEVDEVDEVDAVDTANMSLAIFKIFG